MTHPATRAKEDTEVASLLMGIFVRRLIPPILAFRQWSSKTSFESSGACHANALKALPLSKDRLSMRIVTGPPSSAADGGPAYGGGV